MGGVSKCDSCRWFIYDMDTGQTFCYHEDAVDSEEYWNEKPVLECMLYEEEKV